MTGRDYAGEMRAIIDAETGEGIYYTASVAEHIVAKLEQTDPELLTGWLTQQAQTLVAKAINQRDASVRAYARAHGARVQFGRDAASGDPERIRGWLDVRYTMADGSRKRLAEMTVDDLMFVADTYLKRAAAYSLRYNFLTVLIDSMSEKDTVGKVHDNESLDRAWHSLLGGD